MAIPVIDALLQAAGLITRRKALAVFGHKSYEFNSRKTVEILMDEQPLAFDLQSAIEAISRGMTARDELRAFEPGNSIIVNRRQPDISAYASPASS